MTWTERKQLAVPEEMIPAANAIAAVLDPDTGGAQTFTEATHSPSGVAPATHAVAHTQLKEYTYGLLAEGSPSDIADEVKKRADDLSIPRAEIKEAAAAMELEVGYKPVEQSMSLPNE